MGPIQIFFLGFEDFRATVAVAEQLAALNDAGTIQLVDVRFLLKIGPDDVTVMEATDFVNAQREDLRVAATALLGLAAGREGDRKSGQRDLVIGPDASLGIGDFGVTDNEFAAVADELGIGEALLMVVFANVWAAGLASSLRAAKVTFAQQDYLAPAGLIALGTMLGLDVAL